MFVIVVNVLQYAVRTVEYYEPYGIRGGGYGCYDVQASHQDLVDLVMAEAGHRCPRG